MRRSIVAKIDIPKGKKVELSDINWVRLNGGLAPGNEKKIINKKFKNINKLIKKKYSDKFKEKYRVSFVLFLMVLSILERIGLFIMSFS